MLPRKIYSELKDHLGKKQMTVLTGMRRVGKTTLTKKLLEDIPSKNKLYIDLERFDNRELFSEKNYENIAKAIRQEGLKLEEKIFLAIDELQLAPNSPSILKYLYDHYDIKFILTGSSSYYLKNLFTESLAGRKKIFEIYPLDFGEMLTFQNVSYHQERDFFSINFSEREYERLKSYYEEYVEYGGFPEVVLANRKQDKEDLLKDIISSYLNLDVKSLADFHDQKGLTAIMRLLALRTGTKLDYSKLSRILGIARQTVNNYCEFFEKTYIIKRISVHTKNRDREIVKAQKIYFLDNGILNILAAAGSGAKFENAVFNQLNHKGDLRYFSLKNGKEIDFILDENSGLEIKESPTMQDEKNLKELGEMAYLKNTRLIGRYPAANFINYIWAGQIT